ncbi:MAG: toll/interleukin-1 receptor domain-containing protein [Ignavibacteriaceae bacterium]
MANHINIFRNGVKYWNEWRYSNPEIQPELDDTDFGRCNLEGINFSNTVLTGSSFINSNLRNSNLYQAECFLCSFHGAILDESDMSGAKLHNADFTNSSLKKVDLFRVDFINTILHQADFSNSSCNTTAFSNVDLNTAIGLDSIIHEGPSNIDILTIFRLKEPLPRNFLKGAGIPDNFIEYITSFSDSPIKFFNCFISYNENDDNFSSILYNDLIKRNIRCWRWKEEAKIGKELISSIDYAIKSYDKLILICSKNSLNSPAVFKEIERALLKEETNFKNGLDSDVLFPITIDEYIYKEWDHYLKPDIMKKRIGDFTDWQNHKKYNDSLEFLIKCLIK